MNCLIFTSIIYLSSIAQASITAPRTPKNGLIETGNALIRIVDENDKNSLLSKCKNEDRSIRLFSNSCTELSKALKKNMSMMAIQSDLQIQSEANRVRSNSLSNEKTARLAKINLLATHAEDTIQSALNNSKSSDSREEVPGILSAVKKVQISFLAYSNLIEK